MTWPEVVDVEAGGLLELRLRPGLVSARGIQPHQVVAWDLRISSVVRSPNLAKKLMRAGFDLRSSPPSLDQRSNRGFASPGRPSFLRACRGSSGYAVGVVVLPLGNGFLESAPGPAFWPAPRRRPLVVEDSRTGRSRSTFFASRFSGNSAAASRNSRARASSGLSRVEAAEHVRVHERRVQACRLPDAEPMGPHHGQGLLVPSGQGEELILARPAAWCRRARRGSHGAGRSIPSRRSTGTLGHPVGRVQLWIPGCRWGPARRPSRRTDRLRPIRHRLLVAEHPSIR